MLRLALTALLALALTGCRAEPEPIPDAVPAPQQAAKLDWDEPFPTEAPRLVFGVESFAVTSDGWSAVVRIDNETDITWRIGSAGSVGGRQFGLMLFATGSLDEVEERNQAGSLPGIRRARSFDPALPAALAPGASYEGTIAAPGSLAAGLFVRVTFGLLTAVGSPPAGVPDQVLWITDHAYELADER